MKETFRRIARRFVPPRVRRALREIGNELPIRIHDLPADLRELWPTLNSVAPLPPARLRRAVSLSSSRSQFLSVGRAVAEQLAVVSARHIDVPKDAGAWLDFGCGSGRVSRFLDSLPQIQSLIGVDVDDRAIAWAQRHLRNGEYLRIPPTPPMPFPDAAFAGVFAVSVFSHLAEDFQHAWLVELRRVLRPGGLLIASTHSERLLGGRPDLTGSQRAELHTKGFLFAPGGGPFNDDTAFHTRPYLERTWGRYFTLCEHATQGLSGFQDLAVWRRTSGPAAFDFARAPL